ncbi:iron complex outermembrane receptor protein [Chryseobacterium sp. SORGH_AS 447]|uniref:TonB-dependent siderophore receptor n=1 Tax=Chryseobacterium sp. SORGH_AS_0447 TaxID=3041769 RepID=UPI0027889CD3|nr:TonB-dependent receptor [Chryseobacterium sp. SORGH_AS_0447]MDQ1162590.1 iron complex outermembrane receptor protein [Chryseobacterium sp. SORGH_AS_0447]
MKKILIPCVWLSGLCYGQEKTSDSIKSANIDEVEIIGTKSVIADKSETVGRLPLKNLENSQVYTGITSRLITQQKIYNLDDVVRNAPGISKGTEGWAGNTIYGGTEYTSRGFPTQVKVLNGLANNIAAVSDIQNVSKIEVIKGPSATLFGSIITSYGGLINRVTKKPYEEQSLSVDMSAGGFNFGRVGIDANLPVNKDKTLLSRTNIAYNNQGTFTDNGGYTQNIFVAPSFSYQLNDRIKIDLNTEFNAQKVSGMGSNVMFTLTPAVLKQYVGELLKNGGVSPAYISAVVSKMPTTIQEGFGTNNVADFNLNRKISYYDKNLVSRASILNLNGNVEYKISNQWKSITSIKFTQGSDDGYETRMILLPNVVKGVVAGLLSGNLAGIDYGTPGADYMARMSRKFEDTFDSHQIQQNINGDFKIGDMRNRIVIGLDYYHQNIKSSWRNFQSNKYGSLFGYAFQNIFDTVNIKEPNANYYNFEKNRLDGLYQTSQVGTTDFGGITNIYSTYINDVLNITDHLLVNAGLRFDRFNAKGIFDGTTNKYKDGYNQSAFSPRFGIVYQPVLNKIAIFGNYQTGFSNVGGTDEIGNVFRPEHSYQFETGVKYAFFNGNFTGTLSYYNITVEDKVRQNPNNVLFNIQDGSQKSSGFEAEVLGNVTKNLNVMLGYAYNDSVYEKADSSVNGLRPVSAGAKNQANIWVHYHFDTNNFIKNFSVGAGANYVGETYVMNQYPDGALISPAYTLVNAKISYDRPSYSFALRINNLTNENIWTGYTTVYPQMPRQVVGSVALKF